MVLSCIISEIKRDIGPNIAIIFISPPFDAAIKRVVVATPFGMEKTRIVWLPVGEKV